LGAAAEPQAQERKISRGTTAERRVCMEKQPIKTPGQRLAGPSC